MMTRYFPKTPPPPLIRLYLLPGGGWSFFNVTPRQARQQYVITSQTVWCPGEEKKKRRGGKRDKDRGNVTIKMMS